MKAAIPTAFAACVLVSACGGGAEGSNQGADAAALAEFAMAGTAQAGNAGQRRRALASSDTFSAALASQLFNLAESSYAAYFPSKQASRTFDVWAYRYYPETDVYLAVIGSGVFVLGGPFGPEAVRVGAVTDFVGQPLTGTQRPLTASILGQCPDVTGSTSPSFYSCMVGNLTGTQTFDTAKSCRLEVSEGGVLTVNSDGKSGSVGPGFGLVTFLKSSAFGNFFISVTGSGTGAAHLVITANPTISFIDGGTVNADFTPAGSNTASISCKLSVPR